MFSFMGMWPHLHTLSKIRMDAQVPSTLLKGCIVSVFSCRMKGSAALDIVSGIDNSEKILYYLKVVNPKMTRKWG